MAFYEANDKYSATLSSGFTVGQTTLSVNAVPDNTPTIVVVAKGTTSETVFTITGTTASSLTGVVRLKGANVNLDAQMPVTCLNNQEFINQYTGAVSTPESLKQMLYGVDGGSDDTYVVSVDVAPSSYFAGLTIQFKANTVNTGACTLNVNSLGAKSIVKNADEELSDSDIKADEVVTVIYDGTNFQLQTGIPTTLNRAFTWYLDGTSIDGVAGAVYIAPQNMTVKKIYGILTSGTCTVTVKKGATTIDTIACSNSLATETTITSAAITAGDLITVTLSSSSTPVGLKLTVECEQG